MSAESRSFPQLSSSVDLSKVGAASCPRPSLSSRTIWLQLALGYALLETTVWTSQLHLRLLWTGSTAAVLLLFALASRFTRQEMGLRLGSLRSGLFIVSAGLVFAVGIRVLALLLGQGSGTSHAPGVNSVGEYIVWALVQQFLLQSFFFVRLESLLEGKNAVWAAAGLFAFAHLPNPVLTSATLLGGLFFCHRFRRCRSILPLGLVHALLGLTIAYSFPDALLHHMRVGIAYLTYH